MLLNFGAWEDSWEPLGQQGDQTNQTSILWIFTGRTDAEAEAPILWAPDVKCWLTGKDSHVGKGWQLEEKAVTEDEMVGWHHRLNGHEFEESLGDSGEQQNLVCCSPCGHKESDTTQRLNNKNKWLLLPGHSHQVNTYLTELWRNMSLLIYTCVKRRWSRSKLLIHSHCPSSLQSGPPELATWPVVPSVGVVGWEILSGQHGTFSIFMRDGEITRDCFYKEIEDWHIYLAQQMERF